MGGDSQATHHETRQNLFRTEEEQAVTTEATPLLHRFAQSDIPSQSPSTTLTRVCLLLLILVFGAFISIYLLVLQSESENVLPPVDMPLQLVSRYQWDHSNHSRQLLHHSPFKATSVIIVHTETQQCVDIHSCNKLLNELQKNSTGLPYNFLISSNGQTYEMLGWHEPSLMFPEVSNALVLAFIGNFTDIEPTRAQMLEANNFYAESISHQYLDPKFALIGKTTENTPKQLFLKLKQLPQWKGELSDEY